MANEPQEPLIPNEEDDEKQIDPGVQEVAEELPAFRAYQHELRQERGLTSDEW